MGWVSQRAGSLSEQVHPSKQSRVWHTFNLSSWDLGTDLTNSNTQERAPGVAQLVACSPSMEKTLGWIPAWHKAYVLWSQHQGGSSLTFRVGGQPRPMTSSLIFFLLSLNTNNYLYNIYTMLDIKIVIWICMLGHMRILYCSSLSIYLVLEIEHRVPCMLGTFNATELQP